MLKCPLFCANRTGAEVKGSILQTDCLKEECAQFDRRLQQCNEISKTQFLHDITLALEAIKEKMPHELQFRK